MGRGSGGRDSGHRRILAHYERYDESTRFGSAAGELEFERTKAIVARYLPPAPAVVLDVGGGPGAYLRWLLEPGYSVHLVDPVARHIEQARAIIDELGAARRATATVGSAVELDVADDNADAALLLGPLYHLPERSVRIAALAEARRVLKKDGVLVAAAISRFASLLDGLRRRLLLDPEFVPIVRRDLRCGQHRNPTGNPDYFTDAFFHHPDELEDEVREAGFREVRLVAVEGPIGIDPRLESDWSDPEFRELLLELAQAVEDDRALLGASPHILAVAR